jgi:copper chaperone CopZ
MKTLIKISVVAAILISVFGANTYAQILKADIIATGLTCSMCSNAINKQFKNLPDVDSVHTELNSNTFSIYLKKENKLTPDFLRQKVEKAGFFVGSMVLTIPFDKQSIADNFTLKLGNFSVVFVLANAEVLNGYTQLKVMDKGFILQKEYKKTVKEYAKYPTYGKKDIGIYHVKKI